MAPELWDSHNISGECTRWEPGMRLTIGSGQEAIVPWRSLIRKLKIGSSQVACPAVAS